MAPVGARKDWAVSGERLAFYTTKKLGVKVRNPGKLEILVLLTRASGKNPRITCSSSSRASNPTLSASFLLTSAPGKRASRPRRILAMDRGERAGRLACQMMRCSPADLMFDRGAHRCMLAVHEARVFVGKQRPPRVFQLLQPL